MEVDLFGNKIVKDVLLRDYFIEPPFSVLDSKTGLWQNRKREWLKKGIKSEIGRNEVVGGNICGDFIKNPRNTESGKKFTKSGIGISIFDPALCEVLYHWFCPTNGKILDPFAGGSVRGIVANYLGYKYTGIDIRQEQIDSNREQALNILGVNNQPQWYVGDSNAVLDGFYDEYDFVFSCPPYADLEVYSDLPNDISNMPYNEFMIAYKSIIKKTCNLLKTGGYACFVIGEVRDRKGHYIGFIPDTIKSFMDCGMYFYNDIVLLNTINTASMRANIYMRTKKVVKIHQNILVFKKP
jgi:DNA modification methylase